MQLFSGVAPTVGGSLPSEVSFIRPPEWAMKERENCCHILTHRSFGLTMVKSESLLLVEPSSGLEEPEVAAVIRGS